MMTIIIHEHVKFTNHPLLSRVAFEHAYKVGYWNVYKHTDELEQFCILNHIDYSLDEK